MSLKIEDARSLGQPYEPYSAYCKVCWYQVYRAWIDDEPHNGVCPHGHERADKCPDAMQRAAEGAQLKRALAATDRTISK